MTDQEKLADLKIQLGITDTVQDAILMSYLDRAGRIINKYKYGSTSTIPTSVDEEDDDVQVDCARLGYALRGMENQTSHNESGVVRSIRYGSMEEFVYANVTPYVGI